MSYTFVASLLLRGTVNILYWSGGSLIYIATPNTVYNVVGGVYNWWYPPKNESQQLLEELKDINKHLIELREAVVVVDKDGNSKDIIIDAIPISVAEIVAEIVK